MISKDELKLPINSENWAADQGLSLMFLQYSEVIICTKSMILSQIAILEAHINFNQSLTDRK